MWLPRRAPFRLGANAGYGSCRYPVSRRLDVVGGEWKAAGAALWRPDAGSIRAASRGARAGGWYVSAPSYHAQVMILGVLLILAGAVWVAQGLDLPFAPGSFMTADPLWAVIGGAALLVGVLLVVRALRR